jgi:hypothetical protein
MSAVRFLKRTEIDDKKWNALIEHSVCSLPYAFTWYLDTVAEHWDALIYEDYALVMPLVWLRKFGVKCLYQPYYCQQLGVFSTEVTEASIATDFIHTAAKNFNYVDINLNPSAATVSSKFSMTAKKNLLLDLRPAYREIQKLYTDNHKRNITKAGKAGLVFTEETELKQFQRFYLENINPEKEKFKPKHAKIFKSLTSLLSEQGLGKIFAATDIEENLLAAVLLIPHGNRLIGIINTSSAQGKKSGAAHFLFDRVIEKYSGQNYLLDFEGSSIPGVARFYEGFGGKTETFYNFRHSVLKNAVRLFQSP